MPIEQADAEIGDRPPDRTDAGPMDIFLAQGTESHVDGCFRDPIHVHQLGGMVAGVVVPGRQAGDLKSFATEDDGSARVRQRWLERLGIHQLPERAGRLVEP